MRFLIYLDSRREYRWTLYAGNNRALADSGEGYKNQADCVHAVNLIAGGVAGIPIHYGPGLRP